MKQMPGLNNFEHIGTRQEFEMEMLLSESTTKILYMFLKHW